MASTPILLVDDDLDLAEALSDALNLEGFELHTTATPEQAIALSAELAPRLVLVDFQLPGVDPAELIAELREACSAPIILCTGMGDAVALAAETGADGALAKPFRIEQLLSLARTDQPAATP